MSTKLEYKGHMYTKGEIAKIGNLPWYVVDQRYRMGWDAERIVNTPVKKLNTKRAKQNICDEKSEYECLNCTRPKCIYDEEQDDRENVKKQKNRTRNDAGRTRKKSNHVKRTLKQDRVRKSDPELCNS